MRIGLIQLPLIDPSTPATAANIPLAAGYLKANIGMNSPDFRRAEVTDIIIAPRELTDSGGDRAIVTWICENDFDILGFTCYMWNVERSLYIAGKVKTLNSNVLIIAGGPEITADCGWLDNPNIDTFVTGEGEQVFGEIADRIARGEKTDRVVTANPVRDLGSIRNPYLSGALSIREGDAIPVETTRGCPYGCTYCFYSKTRDKPRHFPVSNTRDFFSFADANSAKEIYVMDPSFNSQSGLQARLRAIRDANKSRIPIHTEINLELVDDAVSFLMKDAGFASVEVGLQSVNTRALKAVKRYFHAPRFLRGLDFLKERGIAIRTGIIVGLPEDTIEGFQTTCDFIADNALVPGVEIYPLSVLPGTVLKQRSRSIGLEYMNKPPYWVIETGMFSVIDFLRARDITEERLGLDMFHDIVPMFGNPGEFIGFLDTRKSEAVSAFIDNPGSVSNTCTILFDEATLATEIPSMLGRSVKEFNPNTCIQLVVLSDRRIEDDVLIGLSDFFFKPDSYIERMHSFDDDNQGRFGTRVFQATGDICIARTILDECGFADPLLVYKAGSIDRIVDFLTEEQPFILVGASVGERELDRISRIYAEHPEYIVVDKVDIGI